MPVAVKPVVDTADLRRAAKAVREIDPKIRTQLIRDLKAIMKPYADRILAKIPSKPPLSGMGRHQGRLRWEAPQYSLHATPGGGKGSLGRIEFFSKQPYGAMFKLADLAGTRNRGEKVRREHTRQVGSRRVTVRTHPTRSGDVLIEKLSSRYELSAGGKGGRFVWKEAMEARPELVDLFITQLDKYAADIERGGLE
jgi:hypothetical protein